MLNQAVRKTLYLSERVIKLKSGKLNRQPTNVFLIEIIICLLFFIISAAVIMKAFAVADNKSDSSSEIENVIVCSESIAEAYSVNGDFGKASKLVFGKECSEREIALDKNCTLSENGYIKLAVSEEESQTSAGILKKLKLIFSKEGDVIYNLDCATYIGGDADE